MTLEEFVRRGQAAQAAVDELTTPLIVHYLRHGFTLCMMAGTPDTWPETHRWVMSPHEAQVTCPACRAEIERRIGAAR